MKRCECGFLAKTPAGLAAHKRRAHPETGGDNRKAAERFLIELRKRGLIEPVDVALVQTLRSLADALDADSSNAQMWKVYRETIEGLLKQNDHSNDGLEAALAELGRAPVGNPSET